MRSDVPLDYAEFQLSPKRTRCELFVSSGASTEKLARGLLRPFVEHLKVAEEKIASAAQSFKLEIGRCKNGDASFTKGTLERFVQFVSTPEVLELVNTFDAEMSQLEAARKIYSQGTGDQPCGGGGSGVTATDDATKKELLRAIDLRLGAVQQDLSNACARAVGAGFHADSVSELQTFADTFGAHRLNDACDKFISLCEKRPNLINQWKPGPEDRAARSSCGSDMSIDDDPPSPPPPRIEPATFSIRRAFSGDSIAGGDKPNDAVPVRDSKNETSAPGQAEPTQTSQPARRLSVQDRINMFESKQKESSGGKPAVVKPSVELRRLSSDVSAAAAAEKAVLRRWSGVSDMSIDLSFEKKDAHESPLCTLSSSSSSTPLNLNDDAAKSALILKPEMKVAHSLNRASDSKSNEGSDLVPGESDGLKDHQVHGKIQSRPTTVTRADIHENSEKFKNLFGGKNESVDYGQLKAPHGGEDPNGPQSQTDRFKTQDSSSAQMRRINGSKGDGHVHISKKREDSTLKSMGESGVRIREDFAAHQEAQPVVETEVVEKKESRAPEKVSGSSVLGVEDSRPRRMKFSRAAELGKKAKSQVDENGIGGFDSFTTPPPPRQVESAMQSKGNRELNNELKMKANELEKLFAEHKLRDPRDQSNSISPQPPENYRSNKPIRSSKNKIKSSAASVVKKRDSQSHGDALNGNFAELRVSEGSRGKLYDKYFQKRDAKLKEDWSSNRVEKEARLKSLQDSLERSSSEMKAKFSGSQDSVFSARRRRAERLGSYNSRSTMNRQQYLGFEDGENDDEALDFLEKNCSREDRAFDDISFGDDISRGSQGKKLLPSDRNLSSTPCSSAAPVPRSATKTYNNNSAKRKTQLENPLAQSAPNFSDLRKENTKPSSKTTSSQVRNYGRSKTKSDEAVIVKEDKLQLHALRKSDEESFVLTPIKFDEEIRKSVGRKAFLKKGSRVSVSRKPEHVNNVDDDDDGRASGPDEFESAIKDEAVEEIETLNSEEVKISENSVEEIDEFVNYGSENGDSTITFSRIDQALGSQLPIGSMQEWPGEISDVHAYVDSPVESPSWTSHSFSQMEAEAARMRRKWGTAQKPVLVSNPSNVARKDVTRGFKRFLKFGRKNRASDSLADWVSVTTSEGDDDNEDGQDFANRSSDDLGKSRMGSQPCDDGFNGEFFNESAPRSFFSLSTFRSKGSDSKPR